MTSALNALRQQNDTSRWKAARLALSALEATEPNIEFVTGIRRDIEYYLQRTQQGLFRFVYVIAGTRPLGAPMAGVLCTLVVLLVILGSSLLLMALGDTKADDVTTIDEMRWVVFPMVLFAALGSFVSIFVRLDQFADTESDDPFLTFCTGFFKPFIGIGFALFIYAVCRSDLIRINDFQLSSLSHHAFYAIGFLSGFSERFASDIITRAENRFVPPSAHSPVAATSASRPDQPHKSQPTAERSKSKRPYPSPPHPEAGSCARCRL